jgi:MFS family permease
MREAIPLHRNRSFVSLAATQFLGAINDHVFKMVVALFAVGAAVQFEGSGYLSLSGALFVAPYILFSNYAGRLADRHSKRSLLVVIKFAEIGIMAIALCVLAGSNALQGLLLVLFLMATQSAFFSPSKYGLLPELIPDNRLLNANGILEASRYAAIILGTLIGGLLMEVWSETPSKIGMVTVVIAIAGFLCSLGIRTPALQIEPTLKAAPTNRNLLAGLVRIWNSPALTISVASITFFETVATLALLDVLLLAKIDLGVGDGPAGILAACAAVGAGIGAYFCGKVCGSRIELGMTPIAGLCLAAALLAAAFESSNYNALAAALVAVGLFGGMYFLPCLTRLQKATSKDERGLVISTNNFVNMFGVLGASGALWFLHDLVRMSPRAILFGCALATLLFVIATVSASKSLRKATMLILRRSFRALILFTSIASERSRTIWNFMRLKVSGTNIARGGIISFVFLLFLTSGVIQAFAGEEMRQSTYQVRHELWGEVGTLTQDIVIHGADSTITTRLTIHVSLLGITVHRMNAEWHEQWEGGVLSIFEGTTVTNGDTVSISGHRSGHSFIIQTPQGTLEAPLSIHPVNPWSTRFVEANFFMSPETGRITRSHFVDAGPNCLDIGDKTVVVRTFRTIADGEHTLHFSQSGGLVRFEHSDALGKIIVTRVDEGDSQFEPTGPF